MLWYVMYFNLFDVLTNRFLIFWLVMTESAGEALKVGDEKLGGGCRGDWTTGPAGPETCQLRDPQNMSYDSVWCVLL